MKLKKQTFAVIAEKKHSISHKWFNQFTRSGNNFGWWRNDIYVMSDGTTKHASKIKPPNIPIYTESEFEALIKKEEKESVLPPPPCIKLDSEPKLTISNQFAREIIAERFNLQPNDIRIE